MGGDHLLETCGLDHCNYHAAAVMTLLLWNLSNSVLLGIVDLFSPTGEEERISISGWSKSKRKFKLFLYNEAFPKTCNTLPTANGIKQLIYIFISNDREWTNYPVWRLRFFLTNDWRLCWPNDSVTTRQGQIVGWTPTIKLSVVTVINRELLSPHHTLKSFHLSGWNNLVFGN